MTLIDGRLKKPITIGEIARCIGAPSGNLGHLAKHRNVNPLSRYKPVENPNVLSEMTDAQFKEVDWGYQIPINPVNLTVFSNYIRNGVIPEGWEEPLGATNGFVDMGMGWYYIRPMTYARMLDFDRYNHNTRLPLFSSITAPEKVYSDTTSVQIDLARGTFWLDDFNTFTSNNAHLGVIITKADSGPLYFKSVTEEENGFAKVILNEAEARQVFGEAGEYVCYAIATSDEGQNILQSGDNYISGSGISIWPLPTSQVTITSMGISGGTSDNIMSFNITTMEADDRNVTFSLIARNGTDTIKQVQWLRYRIDVVDDEGNSWSNTTGNPVLLENSALGVQVPATSEVTVGEFTIPYAAYRYLTAPWTVTLSLYHGQQESFATGEYMGAGTANYYYEG